MHVRREKKLIKSKIIFMTFILYCTFIWNFDIQQEVVFSRFQKLAEPELSYKFNIYSSKDEYICCII